MDLVRNMLDNVKKSTQAKPELNISESLRETDLAYARVVRHGFPAQPTCLAFDAVQKLLAIGTANGSVRLFGKPGVEYHLRHAADAAVITVGFLVNEGALLTACKDDSIHLWNFRQKKPEIVHSLQFQREALSCISLPFRGRYIYAGTDKGNVHVISVETFELSGYVINWNKAIELSQRTHPGCVVHLSQCPVDESKILIGFERGNAVLWDLKSRAPEVRYQCHAALTCIAWHLDGRQFVAAHADGALSIWTSKSGGSAPVQVWMPHAPGVPVTSKPPGSDQAPATPLCTTGGTSRAAATAAAAAANANANATCSARSLEGSSNALDALGGNKAAAQCRAITWVDWKHTKGGDEFLIFAGGMPLDESGVLPAISVFKSNKALTVLEMEHNIVAAATLCTSAYASEPQDPFAVAVLLKRDFLIVDLTTQGYPCFENPYPMHLHESPVTACLYYSDAPHDVIPALYAVGKQPPGGSGGKQAAQGDARGIASGYSDKKWPITGGEWGSGASSRVELVVTGHLDGSVKFWDASSENLQMLYKLKSARHFERPLPESCPLPKEVALARVTEMRLCLESRTLAVAGGAGQCSVFHYDKKDCVADVPAIEVPPRRSKVCSSNCMQPPPSPGPFTKRRVLSGEIPAEPDAQLQQHRAARRRSSASSGATDEGCDHFLPVKVRHGQLRRPAGFQPSLVCITQWRSAAQPEVVRSLALNTAYGLLAYGLNDGLAIIDVVQHCLVVTMSAADLYGGADPFLRLPPAPPDVDGEPSNQAGGSGDQGDGGSTPSTGPGRPPRHRPITAGGSPSLQPGATLAGNTLAQQHGGSAGALVRPALSPSPGAAPATPPAWRAPSGSGSGRAAARLSARAYMMRKVQTVGVTRELFRQNSVGNGVAPDAAGGANAGQLLQPPLQHGLSADNGGRSRCSSESSQPEQLCISEEAVTCLQFVTSAIGGSQSTAGSEPTGQLCPCLWAGTSQGTAAALQLHLCADEDERAGKPVSVTPLACLSLSGLQDGGKRQQAAELHCIALLDATSGALLVPPADSWKECNLDSVLKFANRVSTKRQRVVRAANSNDSSQSTASTSSGAHGASGPANSTSGPGGGQCPTSDQSGGNQCASGELGTAAPDAHLLVLVAARRIAVYGLPSAVLYVEKCLDENDALLKASVEFVRSGPAILGLTGSGHLCVYSLPYLRPLLSVRLLARAGESCAIPTLDFSRHGHAVYMCSASELQKVTVNAELAAALSDVLGQLFLGVEMPERPRAGLADTLGKLFSSSASAFDADEVFGDSSGKASKSVARYVSPPAGSKMEQAKAKSANTTNVVAEAHRKLLERGEKLGQVEDATAKMADQAKSFGSGANQLKQHYQNKKWWQF